MTVNFFKGSSKEQGEFLVKILLFKRVMKCPKDHRCSLCGRPILTGTSYFYSLDPYDRTGYFFKFCKQCFDQRLWRPAPPMIPKGLDKPCFNFVNYFQAKGKDLANPFPLLLKRNGTLNLCHLLD